MKLTERNIVFVKPGRHAVGDGLYLYVSPDRKLRRWFHRYSRPNGAGVTEAGLGPWPVVTVEDARAKVLDHRRMLRNGIDPIQNKRAERQAGITLKEAAAAFIEQHRQHWSPGHLRDVEYMIDVHVKTIASVPVATLTQAQVHDALKPLWATCPDQAHRTLAMLKRVLKHAGRYDMEYKLPKLRKNGDHHHAAMDYADLPDFIQQLRTHQSRSAAALEFLILTACRTGEVLNARWDEINWEQKLWVIPATRTKTRKPHRVPLSPTAIDLLRTLLSNSPYIFTGYARGIPAPLNPRSAALRAPRPEAALRQWRLFPSRLGPPFLCQAPKPRRRPALRTAACTFR